MDNDLELQDYKINCLKDKEHEYKINKLCESHKHKQLKYMKECIIANKIISLEYKINYNDIEFID